MQFLSRELAQYLQGTALDYQHCRMLRSSGQVVPAILQTEAGGSHEPSSRPALAT